MAGVLHSRTVVKSFTNVNFKSPPHIAHIATATAPSLFYRAGASGKLTSESKYRNLMGPTLICLQHCVSLSSPDIENWSPYSQAWASLPTVTPPHSSHLPLNVLASRLVPQTQAVLTRDTPQWEWRLVIFTTQFCIGLPVLGWGSTRRCLYLSHIRWCEGLACEY